MQAIRLKFKNVCCIYPTAPFIEENDILETYKMLNNNKDKFFSITEFSICLQVFSSKRKINYHYYLPKTKKRTKILKKFFMIQLNFIGEQLMYG